MKILVVEDEPKLNAGIVDGLKQRGFVVDSALDGVEGESLATLNAYDAIVLDIMMPRQDGMTTCRSLRAKGIATPVLFLTAKDAVEDKVAGLNFGGDDYLVKPFAFDELVARLHALGRRPHESVRETLNWKKLILDPRSQTITIDNKPVELTLREYVLLEYLLRNKGAVVTREDIITSVWDRFFDSFSNVVDVHVKNLRKKLPKPYAKAIETVWGKGYRLVE